MNAAWLGRYGVLLAFGLLYVVNLFLRPDFYANPENIRNLMTQNVVVGILAIGMTLVILSAGIDLSVGSMVALAGSVALTLMNQQMNGGASESTGVWIAVVMSLVTGVGLGVLNGLVIAYGRVTPFITTLIGLLAYRSLALAIGDGGEIRASSTTLFRNLANEGVALPIRVGPDLPLVINWGIFAWLGMALLGSLLLNLTRFGRYVIALGANARAARYSGVAIDRVKLMTYGFCGLCGGVAALFNASRMNSLPTSQAGLYMELDAIAAVVIGGTSLRGGSGRIWGTVVGVLLLGLINTMLNTWGVSAYWQGVVKGAIILGAVLIQRPDAEE